MPRKKANAGGPNSQAMTTKGARRFGARDKAVSRAYKVIRATGKYIKASERKKKEMLCAERERILVLPEYQNPYRARVPRPRKNAVKIEKSAAKKL